MADYDRPVWWRLKGDERAQAVTKTIDNLQRYQYQRLMRARRNLSMYEGRRLNSLHPAAYLTDGAEGDYHLDQFSKQRIMLARNLVNTAVAKVAGKQRPKASFSVNENDWQTKRKAQKLERFVEAVKASRQGRYHDAWDVGIAAFRDCAWADCGVLKIWADPGAKLIRIDRRLPWEVFFDPAEMKGGNPRNVFDCYGYDRYELAARCPSARGSDHDREVPGRGLTRAGRQLDVR